RRDVARLKTVLREKIIGIAEAQEGQSPRAKARHVTGRRGRKAATAINRAKRSKRAEWLNWREGKVEAVRSSGPRARRGWAWSSATKCRRRSSSRSSAESSTRCTEKWSVAPRS